MSIDESDDVSFLRQRRNIILMSLTILFFELAGIRISELSLAGNKIIVSNPEVIEISLIVFYSYFLIRYHQIYLSDQRNIVLQNAKSFYKTTHYMLYNNYGGAEQKKIEGWKDKLNYQVRSKTHFFFREPAYTNIEFPLHLAITSGGIVLIVKVVKLLNQ